jgi:NADP-dependent 3-hydroxy acid dehydrogenase YdfG
MTGEDSISGKVVVITGASSGIGEITARMLADRGASVMLGARRIDRLTEIVSEIEETGGQAACLETDVTRPDQVNDLLDEAVELFGKVDVLINNAGLMPLSHLRTLKVAEWDAMIDVNIKGVLYGIASALPYMQEQGFGHIINIASIAGHQVFPTGAVYCATKFAVRAITEGLRQEMTGRIKATLISPGPVETELLDHISDVRVEEGMRQIYCSAIDPEAVARAILFAIEQPDDVLIGEIIVRPAVA